MKEYTIEIKHSAKERRKVGKELAAEIRKVDKDEIKGMGEKVQESVLWSTAVTCPLYVARRADNGKLIAAWGLQVIISSPNKYIIWCLGTDELDRVPVSFVKESKAQIEKWLGYYGKLENTVACFNKRSIRWLKRLGATFGKPYKICGNDYMDFSIKAKEE